MISNLWPCDPWREIAILRVERFYTALKKRIFFCSFSPRSQCLYLLLSFDKAFFRAFLAA